MTRNYRNENIWFPLLKEGNVRGNIVQIYNSYIYNPALNRKKRIMYLPVAIEECQRRNAIIKATSND